jgi:FixJ family two-component response regulator
MPDSARGVVIVVEDDASLRQALCRTLGLENITALTYDSGELLLEQEQWSEAICMILDVQLPGMSGFELREQMAARAPVPPVIFITAYDEPEARARAARARSPFLVKPFSGRVLLDTIRRIGAASSDA